MSATMFRTTKPTATKKTFSPKPYRIRLPMLLPIRSSTQLLQDHRVTHILPKLEQLLYTSQEKYHKLYLGALHGLAEYVQQLPSRRNVHFNHVNGCLLLGLLRAYQTIRLYREQTPINSYGRDKVPANIALWSYALYTAALFLGVGEIYATYWISLCDAHGEFKQRWSSKVGPMTQYTDTTHYRYSFEAETRDAIANLDTLVVAEKMLPKEGLEWIASDKYVYELWSAILTGDRGRAGPFAGFILPSEDMVLEQHQDLIESLEDFLLHEQRRELADEHSQELAVELANIDSLNDLPPEQQKEIRESKQKFIVQVPGKTTSIYVNLLGINVDDLPVDMLCFLLIRVMGAMNHNLGSFIQMVITGVGISPAMLQIFDQAFPDFFRKLTAKSLGQTVGKSWVFDPTSLLQNLPRQSPASVQNTLIPGSQPTPSSSPSPTPGPSVR